MGSHFKGGQDFWAVNLRGAKIFLALTFEIIPTLPPPPPIVNDRSLTDTELKSFKFRRDFFLKAPRNWAKLGLGRKSS